MAYSTVPTSSPRFDTPAGLDAGLLLRVDTRGHVGVGHLVRCGALAEEWISAGGTAAMLLDRVDEEVRTLVPAEVSLHRMSSTDPFDIAEVIERAKNLDACWVVLDGYEFGPDLEQAVGSEGFRLLVIDDFATGDHAGVDVVLDQNLGVDPSEYAVARLLIGPRYALLRSAVRAARAAKRGESIADRVVVTFGGAPSPCARLLLARIVAELDVDIDVLGPGLDGPPSATVTYHGIIDDPGPFFRSADVVISAAGSTAWELCHMGAPAVLVALAENQEPLGEAVAGAGAAVYLGPADLVDPSVLVDAVRDLLDDPARRGRMSGAATELVDGLGVRRVVGEMLGDLIELRPAEPGDADLVFGWANDPVVRSAAFNEAPIDWEEHIAWFEQQLNDPGSSFDIVVLGDRPVGQLRLTEASGGRVAEMHLSMDAAFRGYGLGRRVIDAACRAVSRGGRVETIRALVKSSNASSFRAFTRACFVPVGEGTRNGAPYLVLERAMT